MWKLSGLTQKIAFSSEKGLTYVRPEKGLHMLVALSVIPQVA